MEPCAELTGHRRGTGQIVEGLFLTPKMVGGRIGMSTITVIFALFAFGHLFGFVGVLLALEEQREAERG
jgi:hypothetical protein